MRLSTAYGSSTSNSLIIRPEKRSESFRLFRHQLLKVQNLFPPTKIRTPCSSIRSQVVNNSCTALVPKSIWGDNFFVAKYQEVDPPNGVQGIAFL